MLTYTEGDVLIDGINIHYYRTGGNKPPFVLLHGASDNGLCWGPLAEQLAGNYDIIMIDAQGHGKSDRLGEDFQYTDHARQAVTLVKELDIEKPVVMGHSMGGGTATQIAANYPDVPRAVILEDPAWMDQNPSETQIRKTPTREEFAKMVEDYGRMTQEEIYARGREEHPVWSDAELAPWALSKKQFDPTLFIRLQIGRPAYRELVPKITCPTLLITADDGIVPPSVVETGKGLWTSSSPFRHVCIEGAGHNIRREQFDRFMKAVTDFLGEVG